MERNSTRAHRTSRRRPIAQSRMYIMCIMQLRRQDGSVAVKRHSARAPAVVLLNCCPTTAAGRTLSAAAYFFVH